jgi:hypothetical protein
MEIIKKVYRALVPEVIRRKILDLKRKKVEDEIKRAILDYYKKHPAGDKEINEALDYLSSNDLSVFPFPFFNKYKNLPIIVKRDPASGLPYVDHFNKKLYFKRSWTEKHITEAYRFLLAEQDTESPHRYLTSDYQIKKNGIVVDIGAAEGIFAIGEIESIRHLYMVETDKEWIEALNETYKPWKDKVTIINKFISDRNDEINMTLDSYFSGMDIDFLKIDVDGAEEELLRGGEFVVSNKVKQLAICTYHKQTDHADFNTLLKSKQYKTHTSKGYMLFFFDTNFTPPYFRRGLIRAEK